MDNMARTKNESKEVIELKYQICPFCGSNLDFDERCDCQTKHRNMYQKKQFNYDFVERMGIRNDIVRVNRAVSGTVRYGGRR